MIDEKNFDKNSKELEEQIINNRVMHVQVLIMEAARNLKIFPDSEAQENWLAKDNNSQKLREWLTQSLLGWQSQGKELVNLSEREQQNLASEGLKNFFNYQESIRPDVFIWRG